MQAVKRKQNPYLIKQQFNEPLFLIHSPQNFTEPEKHTGGPFVQIMPLPWTSLASFFCYHLLIRLFSYLLLSPYMSVCVCVCLYAFGWVNFGIFYVAIIKYFLSFCPCAQRIKIYTPLLFTWKIIQLAKW